MILHTKILRNCFLEEHPHKSTEPSSCAPSAQRSASKQVELAQSFRSRQAQRSVKSLSVASRRRQRPPPLVKSKWPNSTSIQKVTRVTQDNECSGKSPGRHRLLLYLSDLRLHHSWNDLFCTQKKGKKIADEYK